jgi:IS605 OrfB family transposase
MPASQPHPAVAPIAQRTFQVRLHGDWPTLDQTAEAYGRAKRALHAASLKPGAGGLQSFKEEWCERFALPSRLFNGLAIDLQGVVDGVREKAKHDLEQLAPKIESAEEKLGKLRGLTVAPAVNQERLAVRIAGQETRLKKLHGQRRAAERQAGAAHPSICFGSKRLFGAQNHLEANGYRDRAAWLADWRRARSSQFLVVGSDDEGSGNKTCRATVQPDGTVDLRLLGAGAAREVPVVIPGIRLPHGHAEWLAAISAANAEFRVSQAWQAETKRLVAGLPEEKAKAVRTARRKARAGHDKQGSAITYRFVRDHYGWRVLVTVSQRCPVEIRDASRGVVAMDLNDDHLAGVRLGPAGEVVGVRTWPLHLRGLTSGQREARIEQAAAELVAWARHHGVPIVVEALDFQAKKRRLRELPASHARRLSALAYRGADRALRACARLNGTWVYAVTPAWTSVLGAATIAVPRGLSVHHAAAVMIGRRAMERLARLAAAGVTDDKEIARALLSGSPGHETQCDAVPCLARLPGGHRPTVASALPEKLQRRLPAGRGQALAWHASAWRAALAARRPGRAPPARAGTTGPAVAPGGTPGDAPNAVTRGAMPNQTGHPPAARITTRAQV